MPEKLKNLFFTQDSLRLFAEAIKNVYSDFNVEEFLKLIHDESWDTLALKAKMWHTTKCLHKTLPNNYLDSLVILVKAAPTIKGFEAMTLPDYVEKYGMDHWEESLNALGHFTKYASSEFAIRPFLDKKPELAMHYMLNWAESEHENVRRFASEGCRPRLPWAMLLPQFILNPRPIFEVLEKLKDDDSEFVRKSVANNLNDISKDHPDLMMDVCVNWYGYSDKTNWIVKHACRTLLKQGNTRALRLFGFGDPGKLEIKNLKLSKSKIKIGESINFSFQLNNQEEELCKVRLEYAIDFVKARGKSSRKIFQIIEKEYKPGIHLLKRKHSFANLSTRKHYPGTHSLTIIVNGVMKAEQTLKVI